jgi:adenylate cyclase
MAGKPICDTRAIAAWLVDGARSAPRPDLVLAELCDRLVSCGIPLWRVAVFVRTLHPNVMGRRFLWQFGSDVTTSEASFDFLDTAEHRGSPVVAAYATGTAIRRRLADKDCPDDFAVLGELRAQGVTDYVASPLIFTDGSIHGATWSTRQPGGFSDAQICGLEAIVAPLARVAEIRALRRTASNLLDTYVGNQAGERILAGQIRRGHTEAIHAVIWLSDMRGFTVMADRLPPQDLVDLLNSGMVARCSSSWAMVCSQYFRSAKTTRIRAGFAIRFSLPPVKHERMFTNWDDQPGSQMSTACALGWRSTWVTCCMAISAAATAWISRASAPL